MENVIEFERLLTKRASELGVEVKPCPEMTSQNFKGRGDVNSVALPRHIRGVRFGKYPVILGELKLEKDEKIEEQIKGYHNQAIVARSFLSNEEIVDIHVFLICIEPKQQSLKWLSFIDKIERDEAYCRKLVWAKEQGNEKSFDNFVDRTFLARPWLGLVDEGANAQLDYNARLVQQVLEGQGLTAEAAAKWIKILNEPDDDHQKTVDELVEAMGDANE